MINIWSSNGLVLHKIKDIQIFNTQSTLNCPFLTIHFMTNETNRNFTKFIVMKIHKYINILKVIILIYNPNNSWGICGLNPSRPITVTTYLHYNMHTLTIHD